MERNKSREDYLEAILMEGKLRGSCRSIDVARHLGFSKPSVSIAVAKLVDEGYVLKEDRGELRLTEKGLQSATRVLEKHEFFTRMLIKVGVDEKTASEDACRMEHAITEESFQKLKKYFENA